jgi:hypothetical protein
MLQHTDRFWSRISWAKNNLIASEHTSYSPNLSLADFYPFFRLRSGMKGRRLCDTTDIIVQATEELKRLSQNYFQECPQHLYSRWQKFIAAQGDYF